MRELEPKKGKNRARKNSEVIVRTVKNPAKPQTSFGSGSMKWLFFVGIEFAQGRLVAIPADDGGRPTQALVRSKACGPDQGGKVLRFQKLIAEPLVGRQRPACRVAK